MNYARIAGVGCCLPAQCLSNDDLKAHWQLDTSDAWIRSRTGIRQRYFAAADETTSDLAYGAACQALQRAAWAASDIELIIVATTTADSIFPSTACLLQGRLGASGGPAFDVQAVCTGFVYALVCAEHFIRAGTVRRALVVGAETFSRILNPADRQTCVLFGDGAGAVLLEAAEQPGILWSRLCADGNYAELLQVPGGISKHYPEHPGGRRFVEMQGRDVFRMAVKTMHELIVEALRENNLSSEQLDWLIPHQANERIMLAVAQKQGLPVEKVIQTVAEHANTSAASIPLALERGISDGRIQRGQLLLLEAFGGGFTWGSVLLRY